MVSNYGAYVLMIPYLPTDKVGCQPTPGGELELVIGYRTRTHEGLHALLNAGSVKKYTHMQRKTTRNWCWPGWWELNKHLRFCNHKRVSKRACGTNFYCSVIWESANKNLKYYRLIICNILYGERIGWSPEGFKCAINVLFLKQWNLVGVGNFIL